ncbi:MAG TPA: type II toxin-antitoxin system HicB family antitoxin [Waddliaceae bacterium]
MKKYKNLDYYINLPWTYTIETEIHKGKSYYIIRVNELPGICTDNEDLNEGMESIKEAIACAVEIYLERGEPVPEPVDRSHYKGRILYRTDSERHYLIAKAAKSMHKSISKTLDVIVDAGIQKIIPTP